MLSQTRGLLAGTRVVAGFSAFGDNNSEDCFGHGTHVAGIVGGLTHGVAKNATLVPGQWQQQILLTPSVNMAWVVQTHTQAKHAQSPRP